jgi:hypothetical protein
MVYMYIVVYCSMPDTYIALVQLREDTHIALRSGQVAGCLVQVVKYGTTV